MTQPPMQQVLIRMPAEMLDKLREQATAEDRTVAAEVRRAVREYLKRER